MIRIFCFPTGYLHPFSEKGEKAIYRSFFRPVKANSLKVNPVTSITLGFASRVHPTWVSMETAKKLLRPRESSLSLSLALLLSKITRYLQIPRYFEHRWKICRMTRNRMALLDTQRRKDERFPRYSRIPGRKIDLSVITWTNILGMFVNIWKKGALMSLCMYYHVLMIK